jgi:hypothetical protein
MQECTHFFTVCQEQIDETFEIIDEALKIPDAEYTGAQ